MYPTPWPIDMRRVYKTLCKGNPSRDILIGEICKTNTLICLFAEAAFSGAWKARLLGAESFSETTGLNMRGALFLWDALQCHRVMYDYVDMNFVNHQEISAVIVEHLIKTRVPLEHHQKLKDEVDMFRSTVKAFTSSMDKMESRIGRAELDIKKKKNKD
jgi:hypothetical protein